MVLSVLTCDCPDYCPEVVQRAAGRVICSVPWFVSRAFISVSIVEIPYQVYRFVKNRPKPESLEQRRPCSCRQVKEKMRGSRGILRFSAISALPPIGNTSSNQETLKFDFFINAPSYRPSCSMETGHERFTGLLKAMSFSWRFFCKTTDISCDQLDYCLVVEKPDERGIVNLSLSLFDKKIAEFKISSVNAQDLALVCSFLRCKGYLSRLCTAPMMRTGLLELGFNMLRCRCWTCRCEMKCQCGPRFTKQHPVLHVVLQGAAYGRAVLDRKTFCEFFDINFGGM